MLLHWTTFLFVCHEHVGFREEKVAFHFRYHPVPRYNGIDLPSPTQLSNWHDHASHEAGLERFSASPTDISCQIPGNKLRLIFGYRSNLGWPFDDVSKGVYGRLAYNTQIRVHFDPTIL